MQDTQTIERPVAVSPAEFNAVVRMLEEARAERDALDHRLARIAALPDEWEEKSNEWKRANEYGVSHPLVEDEYDSQLYATAYEAGWDNAGELLRRALA